MVKKNYTRNRVSNNKTTGLYIKNDFLSKLPKMNVITLFQVLRIINSLGHL
jgi:hypothetical protein